MKGFVLVVCLAAVVCALPAPAASDLGLNVGSDGSYTVSIGGKTWLRSADTFVTVNGKTLVANADLKMKSSKPISGEDVGGSYTGTDIEWDTGSGSFHTAFRLYQSHIVFAQLFPDALNNTNISDGDGVQSSFPSFHIESNGVDRGVATFKGDMCGGGSGVTSYPPKEEKFIGNGISGSGPLVLFTKDLNTSTVLSSYSNFMSHSQAVNNNVLSYGVMGKVTSIPANYVLETVLVLSSGVNQAMEEWGDLLLKVYGKDRDGYKNDYAMNYLGYSTDNGAYYYYQTEPNKNYEDTLIDVYNYAKAQGIPYRYILLDSWWYFKGKHDGVTTWDPMPDVFPHGLEYLYNVTGWSQQLHNRYWSADNTYAKQNGGQYDFIIQGEKGVPTEQRFWDDLMLAKKKTGMFMYEQDWLDVEFDDVPVLQTSATLARQWMLQMGEAARRNGVTFQACMSHPRHIMQMIECPAMTNARASGDYHPGNSQWYVGMSSLFAWATGIAPSKDNYWSTPVQPGTHYGPNTKEPYNRLQAAVITLTTGPVAPSDMVGGSDAALIMRSCAKDGMLLQPDRPATECDAFYLNQAFGSGVNGHVWTTYSDLASLRTSYVLAVLVDNTYNLTAVELGYSSSQQLLVFEANSTKTVHAFGNGHALSIQPCKEYDFQLYTAVPVLSTGWALLGESDKWVSVSSRRFFNLASTKDSVFVSLRGSVGESVEVNFADSAMKVYSVTCTFSQTGEVTAMATSDGSSKCFDI
eukprot:m.12039 g.12039  ORF g.12039 m.12039 type:complete len:746 (-) comp6683_c0_seq1:50-2287(-)